MLIHQADVLLAHIDPLLQADFFRKLGKAIIWFLVGIFVVGGLVGLLIGFFVGRAVGRAQGSPSAQPSESEQIPN